MRARPSPPALSSINETSTAADSPRVLARGSAARRAAGGCHRAVVLRSRGGTSGSHRRCVAGAARNARARATSGPVRDVRRGLAAAAHRSQAVVGYRSLHGDRASCPDSPRRSRCRRLASRDGRWRHCRGGAPRAHDRDGSDPRARGRGRLDRPGGWHGGQRQLVLRRSAPHEDVHGNAGPSERGSRYLEHPRAATHPDTVSDGPSSRDAATARLHSAASARRSLRSHTDRRPVVRLPSGQRHRRARRRSVDAGSCRPTRGNSPVHGSWRASASIARSPSPRRC